MKKKGFTLIELLAVIVILAVIALITLPLIMNVIDDARKNSAKDAAAGYLKAAENYRAQVIMDNPKFRLDGTYTIDSQGRLVKGSETLPVEVKGTGPTAGTIVYTEHIATSGCVVIGEFAVEIVNGEAKRSVEGTCNGTALVEKTSENEGGNNGGNGGSSGPNVAPSPAGSPAVATLMENVVGESAVESSGTSGLVRIDHTVPTSFTPLSNDFQNYEPTRLVADESVQATKLANTSIITDYRFMGSNPNNYIYFNCSNYAEASQNSSNCQVWRILGVDENGRIRIVSGESVGLFQYDETGGEQWSSSSLYSLLNNEYYNGQLESTYGVEPVQECHTVENTSSATPSEPTEECEDVIHPIHYGLTAASKSFIVGQNMYAGSVNEAYYVSAAEAYELERGITYNNGTYSYSQADRTTGNIGIMSLSDFLYTSNYCYRHMDGYSSSNDYCDDSWATYMQNNFSTDDYEGNIRDGYAVLSTPTEYGITALDYGYNISYVSSTDRANVYPTVTLTSNFALSGSGTYSNPYKIVASNGSL